jgi:beta-carotene hydroxylase
MAPAPTPPTRMPDLRTLALLLGMYGLLLGNLALYRSAPLPLPVHVLVSAIAIHLAFTVWHEGVHRNVSRLKWINDAIAILGIFPYMTPYFLQKWIHLQHHNHLNQPGDPNVIYTDGPFSTILFRYPRIIVFLQKRIGDDPRSRAEKISDALPLLVVVAIYGIATWQGYLLDVVLLWFLPVVIAKIVMDWYINYLPHVGLPAGRFRGTRIIDVPWLTPFVMGHNYHAIHHLWPALPWHRYRSVFRDEFDYLKEHGVPIEHHVLGYKPRPAGVAGPGSNPG